VTSSLAGENIELGYKFAKPLNKCTCYGYYSYYKVRVPLTLTKSPSSHPQQGFIDAEGS